MRTLHGHEDSGAEDRSSGTGRGRGGGTPKAPSEVAPRRALGRRRLRPEPLRQRKQKLPGAGFSRPPSPEAPLRRTWNSGIRVLPPPLGWGFRLPRPAPPHPGQATPPGLAPPSSSPLGWGPGARRRVSQSKASLLNDFTNFAAPDGRGFLGSRERWGARPGHASTVRCVYCGRATPYSQRRPMCVVVSL